MSVQNEAGCCVMFCPAAGQAGQSGEAQSRYLQLDHFVSRGPDLAVEPDDCAPREREGMDTARRRGEINRVITRSGSGSAAPLARGPRAVKLDCEVAQP